MPTPSFSSTAQAVSAHFADRPSLETVIRQQLASAIAEKYPTLVLDLNRTRLARPQKRGWLLQPFMSVVLDALASAVPLDFSEIDGRYWYLSDDPPRRLKLPGLTEEEIDMPMIAKLVGELPDTLHIALQDALAGYWDTGDTATRWSWLADVLMDSLRVSALRDISPDSLAYATISQLVGTPDRASRIARYGEGAVLAYGIEATLKNDDGHATLLDPDLVLTRAFNDKLVVLLYNPQRGIKTFESMDALVQDVGRRLGEQYQVDDILIERYEPEGNIFEHQAAMLLNRQLQDLGNLTWPSGQRFSDWQALYQEVTDPGRFFVGSPSVPPQTLQALRRHLPAWLIQASADDQASYRRYTLALAGAKHSSTGRTFLSGITDLRTYTLGALLQALQHDAVAFAKMAPTPPSVAALHPDDLLLTFTVAAGYPGTVGITHHEQISLTDLAIANLSSRPSGTVTVINRHSLPLPSWLTPDYLMGTDGLVERVDIGQHYPALLKQHLLGDNSESLQREALFSDQQVAQLPLLALELALQQQSGLSRQGARLMEALVQYESAAQSVDNRQVVIRHLGLLRSSGATADIVSTMYLIEHQDIRFGPHLLYRPLYTEVLQEFSSREALFAAIARTGPLQDSVLTWLSDSARPIYSNGGFNEPHYLRFGLGGDFAPIVQPAPAQLAVDGINDELQQCLVTGRLMSYLFSEHAQALVKQADRESVSNNESRWQVLMEGSSLLFGNLLLPLLRGPAMVTGFLMGLMSSLRQDIVGLNATDVKTRELAAVDLLLNIGLMLFDVVPGIAAEHPHLPPGLKEKVLPPIRPRGTEPWPVSPPASVRQCTVALAGVLPDTNKTVLDFSFSQARHRLSGAQRQRLATFRTPPPNPLPAPYATGTRRGLYFTDNRWRALVEGDWFTVIIEEQDSVVIVDAVDPLRRGPYLRVDELGNWSVDTRLRLVGGMPPRRIAAERQRKAQRITELQTDYQQFVVGQPNQQRTVDVAHSVMERTTQDARFNETQKGQARQRFDAVLLEQTEHYQKILGTLRERQELAIALPAASVAALTENVINNTRKHVVIAELDRQALYEANRDFSLELTGLPRAVVASPAAYSAFIKASVGINERSIRWLELQDRYLVELFNLGSAGADGFTRLTRDRPNEISALAVRDLQVRSLKLMTLSHIDHPLYEALDGILLSLPEHVRTHSELNNLELSGDERISVLESLVEHYGRLLDSLQGIGIINVDELASEYFNQLVSQINQLYQDAAQQLAGELKPVATPAKRPPKRSPLAAGRPQKKVIKTSRKGTFIGEVKSIGTLQTVELRSEVNQHLLGMYSQRGDEWVEFVEQPAPRAPTAPRAPSLLRGEARKLLGMLEDHIRRGDDYRKVSRHPEEVEEILQYESVRYDKLATEFDRAVQAQPEGARVAADQALVDGLRQGAVRLSNRGKELRVQLCLELPPTHGNLQYLIEQKRVNVARLAERIQLSGERRDYIQEYAVNDSKGYPLWYAHFHYPEAGTPNGNYTAAHLKTREQRRQSYYSQLATAKSAQAVVDVHRGLIGKALAERWFLPLAP
jgi:hypothetical protein